MGREKNATHLRWVPSVVRQFFSLWQSHITSRGLPKFNALA